MAKLSIEIPEGSGATTTATVQIQRNFPEILRCMVLLCHVAAQEYGITPQHLAEAVKSLDADIARSILEQQVWNRGMVEDAVQRSRKEKH